MDWWQSFFDRSYLELWTHIRDDERTEREADGLWQVLGLAPGARVLDAPCGYGRLTRALARRGARVLGVDQSVDMIAAAERQQDDQSLAMVYRVHDLRAPLAESGFDAAINIFSSLGYGSEDDDVAVLRTLAGALAPGGRLFVETAHRDAVAAQIAGDLRSSRRMPDGTLMVEEPRFDMLTGRVDTTWYWSGPAGNGAKSASMRIYGATELARLIERAGLVVKSTHAGCSAAPFVSSGAALRGRLGVLAERPK